MAWMNRHGAELARAHGLAIVSVAFHDGNA